MERKGVYFVSDVHLGLAGSDAEGRERRFVSFLKSIDTRTTEALWLLGDIWDFWYEYRDVIPKEGARVVAQLINLMDAGVKVFFIPGNHDIWTYHFFEEIGIRKVEQPFFTQIGGRKFCLGHGDALGGAVGGYRIIYPIFHSRFLQRCFSTIHPSIAYRFGNWWSRNNRGTHEGYVFNPDNEPIVRWAGEQQGVDYFVFGHFHCEVNLTLPGGAQFFIMPSWLDASPYLYFDGQELSFRFFDL